MRAPSPRALLASSAALLVLFAIGLALTRHPRARPAVTTTAPPAFAIGHVQVQPGAFTATLTWRTPVDSTAVVNWGPHGMRPLLWARQDAWGTTHRLRLTGLTPNTRYRVSIAAAAQDEETDTRDLELTTGPVPATVTATTRGEVVRIDGAPFFPLITWQECPDRWAPDVRDGINLFAGNPCTGLQNLLTALAGRALAAGTTEDVPGTTGPGLIGWFYADEADARGLAVESLAAGGPGLRFLTLTSHFFSQAAPLPTGRSMYPALAARADVVGFDLYPLQELCRPELLPWVFDAQRELRQLAPGKPTYQWIEEREIKCPQPAAAVTPATIRVESWLAIAGGATALAFFPNDWSAPTGRVIGGIAARIRQLEPALLQPPLDVTVEPAAPDVRASARTYGGAVYVIAVNAGTAPASVQLHSPELGSRRVTGGAQARDGTLAVTLPAHSVRIYIAAPE
jgi:hypothetical protein